MDYQEFISQKEHLAGDYGFDPVFMPDTLFDFQKHLVEWACLKGRAAIFADCGLGKTFMQLSWAENVVRKTNGRVLILTPLAVSFQTVSEGQKIGIDVTQSNGELPEGKKIIVTNYEKLDRFSESDFEGVVCDESSILKNYDGETRKAITQFMRLKKYRLLCTATAAPNDWIELGTSSEALGALGAQDMINRFFKKAQQTTTARQEHMSGVFQIRPHATHDFWRWVVSWARAVRDPSDLGFDKSGYDLPPLTTRQHTVRPTTLRDGFLFELPAVGLQEQREDLARTVGERCEMSATLVNSHNRAAVVWCNLNKESNELKRMIPDSVEVIGSDSPEAKEEKFKAFLSGDARVLITKPSIAGFGLNMQHCAHQTFFPSHSYEQFYQAVRRCWRFGQKKEVVVDIITTEGQENVLNNLNRKAEQAKQMFDKMVGFMNDEMTIEKTKKTTKKVSVPSWL